MNDTEILDWLQKYLNSWNAPLILSRMQAGMNLREIVELLQPFTKKD